MSVSTRSSFGGAALALSIYARFVANYMAKRNVCDLYFDSRLFYGPVCCTRNLKFRVRNLIIFPFMNTCEITQKRRDYNFIIILFLVYIEFTENELFMA